MKLLFRFVSLVLVRIGQNLQPLQRSLERWASYRVPVLLPIPIQSDRYARVSVGRHLHWGG